MQVGRGPKWTRFSPNQHSPESIGFGAIGVAFGSRGDAPLGPAPKHTADVGSGYDVAPTAQEILRRLGISEEGWCAPPWPLLDPQAEPIGVNFKKCVWHSRELVSKSHPNPGGLE